jgi:hypothetical protein
MKNQRHKKQEEITRKEAIKKIGNYGKWTALASLGTYMILDPQKAQASSPSPASPGEGF